MIHAMIWMKEHLLYDSICVQKRQIHKDEKQIRVCQG